jgi:hypothetical protein
MKTLLAAVLVLTLTACTDEDGAFHSLADAGYTSITITGRVWFGCGFGEIYRTGFVVVGPAKSVVSGVVCQQGGLWAAR